MPSTRPLWHYLLPAATIILLAAGVEMCMGRRLISKSGQVHLWVGKVASSENSQQIADWYSFTHIIHGCVFYAALRLLGQRKWPLGLCLLLAVGIEAGWEVLENTDFVINRYRQATISLDYYGDSVLNSVCDILFCILGFFIAARLPAPLTIALVVFIELSLAWFIRDNLTLNILMLIHPFNGIRHWQMRG